ncbi:MAG TPA: helix-turn-helix transcriptional regulator [Novosphingobium sp.]
MLAEEESGQAGYSAFANLPGAQTRALTVGDLPDGSLLRMYPPGGVPCAGALRSDCVDHDSHWHFHDMHQLICAFEEAIVVESKAGTHLVPPQLAGWIPAGLLHRVSLHRVRSGSVFFPENMVRHPGSRARTLLVSPLMREMFREAMRWPLETPTCALRDSYFATMAGLCQEWITDEADLLLPTSRDARIQKALDFTVAHASARVSEVCVAVGLSERTMRRKLKAETGMTWEAWRQRSRVLRAVTLLSDPSAARRGIAQVAAECGFESPSAFAKAFRAALGENPRNFRARVLHH